MSILISILVFLVESHGDVVNSINTTFGTGSVDKALKVDAAGIRAVIETAFPSPDNVDIVLIGDAAQIGQAAAKLGPVTKMSLSAPYYVPVPGAH